MTVRFKCQSEYQKSYGTSRSRSVSPQRCVPLAGLRSDLMGFSREPGLQTRRRTGPLARSCSSLLFPPDDPAVGAARRAPPAASRSRSAHRKDPSQNQKPSTPPETPAGPRPATDPEPPETPDPGKSAKLRPSEPVSQSLARPATGTSPGGQQPSENKVEQVLRWRVGLRSGGHRSEYHRQFSWKKPGPASPLLTAELVLNSSRSVPPFKANPVLMETEYRRSFRGLVPPTGPRLRKHLEYERVPLFHTQIHKEKRAESHKPHPKQEPPQGENNKPQLPLKDTPPPQVQKRLRMLTEYQSSFRSHLYRNSGGGATDAVTQQVQDLRHQVQWHRHRAWGTNFCRDHLNQLLSEHTALWEPTDTETPTRRLTLSPEADRSTSCVEALDLSSNSSRSCSVSGSGGSGHAHKKTGPGSLAEPRTAWAEEEEEEETTDEDEGRLPTPRLKTRPVQRTHHDLTTPATGGAILVGKLQNADNSSVNKQQKGGMDVSVTTGAEPGANSPARRKEAWSENVPSPSPEHKPASSPPGELGLRSREQPCSRGGCGSDEDDQLSVMSWHSAASCSAASAILERAQRRREDFWGKR